jgi:serine/threonine protein kinase
MTELQTLVIQVVAGVSQIHRAGYEHRDLKLQNIVVYKRQTKEPTTLHFQDTSYAMIPENNTITQIGIIDFGLSVFSDRNKRGNPNAETAAQTVGYRSPKFTFPLKPGFQYTMVDEVFSTAFLVVDIIQITPCSALATLPVLCKEICAFTRLQAPANYKMFCESGDRLVTLATACVQMILNLGFPEQDFHEFYDSSVGAILWYYREQFFNHPHYNWIAQSHEINLALGKRGHQALMSALSWNPDERPQSVDILLVELMKSITPVNPNMAGKHFEI